MFKGILLMWGGQLRVRCGVLDVTGGKVNTLGTDGGSREGAVGAEPQDTLVRKTNHGQEGQSEGRKCRQGPEVTTASWVGLTCPI